jgi:hypothetical protein
MRASDEFKFAEELAGGGCAGRLRLHRFRIEGDRGGAVDGDQLPAEQNPLAVLLEGFAIALLLHLGGALEQGVE